MEVGSFWLVGTGTGEGVCLVENKSFLSYSWSFSQNAINCSAVKIYRPWSDLIKLISHTKANLYDSFSHSNMTNVLKRVNTIVKQTKCF